MPILELSLVTRTRHLPLICAAKRVLRICGAGPTANWSAYLLVSQWCGGKEEITLRTAIFV